MTGERQAPDGQRGFTLIELLVSLAILSLVAGLLLDGVAMMRNVTRRMEHRNQANQEVIAAQLIMRDRIENLQTILRQDRSHPVVDLQGDEHVFSFYALPLDRFRPDGIQAFRLLRMATGDLVLFSASSLSENVDLRSPSLVGWTPTRLMAGVGGLSLSYFGPSPSSPNGNVWQRYWIDQPQPPQLVRVRLNFPPESGRVWPDLLIRPRVTSNLACQIDPVTSRCRGAVQ